MLLHRNITLLSSTLTIFCSLNVLFHILRGTVMEDYRLDCLRLAHNPELRPEDVVARAKAYHDFVAGKVEGPSVEQLVDAYAEHCLKPLGLWVVRARTEPQSPQSPSE